MNDKSGVCESCNSAMSDCGCPHHYIEKLREENEKLKSDRALLVESLSFYADEKNWYYGKISSEDMSHRKLPSGDYVLETAGESAREALKKVGEL